jgi:hypothetical protein
MRFVGSSWCDSFFACIFEGKDTGDALRAFFKVSVVLLAFYGMTMGVKPLMDDFQSGALQMLVSTIKVPVLYLLSVVICCFVVSSCCASWAWVRIWFGAGCGGLPPRPKLSISLMTRSRSPGACRFRYPCQRIFRLQNWRRSAILIHHAENHHRRPGR